MAKSQLGLYNLALQHIGMKRTSSVDATDPATAALNNYYEACRDDLFRELKWPFANVQATLNESSVEEPLGWEFVYEYPTQNCAAVWTVFSEANYDTKDEEDFEVMYDPATAAKVICSNNDDAYYEYTYIVTDPTLWDEKFYMALSYRLAANVCHVLLGDAEKALKMTEISNAVVSEAKRLAAQQKRKKPSQTSAYQNARG